MKISIKILIIIFLSIIVTTSSCHEEFGSDWIKDGDQKPALNYFYPIYSNGEPWAYLQYDLKTPDSFTETFAVASSFEYTEKYTDLPSSWISCTRTDASHYLLSVKYNNSIHSRYGSLSFAPSSKEVKNMYDYEIAIHVSQPGRNLKIYQNNNLLTSTINQTISFSESGGTSKTYEVRADGEYTITKEPNDSWYTIIHSKENNTFVVTTNVNTTVSDREGLITVALAGLPTGESEEIKIKVSQGSMSSSDTYFVSTTDLILDRSYLLVADGRCATTTTSTHIQSQKVNITDGVIIQDTNNAFTFASKATVEGKTYKLPEGQFFIVDSKGRYMYKEMPIVIGSSTTPYFSTSDLPTITSEGIYACYIFAATCNSEGLWTISNLYDHKWIQYDSKSTLWGSYNYEKGILPSLYILSTP